MGNTSKFKFNKMMQGLVDSMNFMKATNLSQSDQKKLMDAVRANALSENCKCKYCGVREADVPAWDQCKRPEATDGQHKWVNGDFEKVHVYGELDDTTILS